MITNSPSTRATVQGLWRIALDVMRQRGILKADTAPPACRALIIAARGTPERVVYVIGARAMGGLVFDKLAKPAFEQHLESALGGRRVRVTVESGIAIQVGLDAHTEAAQSSRAMLPEHISLPHEWLTLDAGNPYEISIGQTIKSGKIETATIDLTASADGRALLIGGTSGGGKTNLFNAIIAQAICRTTIDELRLVVIDPKGDLSILKRASHTLHYAGGLDNADTEDVLGEVLAEIYSRQHLFSAAGDLIGDWQKYNTLQQSSGNVLPMWLLVIDELAQITSNPAAVETLVKIAQVGRSFGISLIVGTQYPTADVVKNAIKANLPARIATRTATRVESRVIIDSSGAEALRQPGRCIVSTSAGRRETQAWLVDLETLDRCIAQANSSGTSVTQPYAVDDGAVDGEQGPGLIEVEPLVLPVARLPRLPLVTREISQPNQAAQAAQTTQLMRPTYPTVELAPDERAVLSVARDEMAGAFAVVDLIKFFDGSIRDQSGYRYIPARRIKELSKHFQAMGWLGEREHVTLPRILSARALAQLESVPVGAGSLYRRADGPYTFKRSKPASTQKAGSVQAAADGTRKTKPIKSPAHSSDSSKGSKNSKSGKSGKTKAAKPIKRGSKHQVD